MKRNILIGGMLVLSLVSCDPLGDIRDGLDVLDGRVAVIEAAVAELNNSIHDCMALITDEDILIRDFVRNEITGDYTITFSDGNVMTVYGGKTDPADAPVYAVDDEGFLCVKDVFDNYTRVEAGDPVAPINMRPVDGETPELIVKNGLWYAKTSDTEIELGPCDNSTVAGGSVFQQVEYRDGFIFFTLLAGGKTVSVPVDDCSLTVDWTMGGTVTTDAGTAFTAGQSRTFPVVQDGVVSIVVKPTLWRVVVTDDELTLTAPADAASGVYTVFIKIVARSGLNKLVKLQLTVN